MFFGSAYYPEHIDRSQIETDAVLMKEAGLKLVRMGEFAWIAMEPEDGKFDFSWLDYAIEVMGNHGIKTLLCTPTASQPKWLSDKHKDIMQINEEGQTREFGKRRHYCINNKNYHFYSQRVVKALAEHYKNNLNVIGYQLDNEFMAEGPYCYCSTCEGDFRTWLRNKYGSIENLNKSWGTIFWGLSYRNWEEIVLPKGDHNPSAVLDFYRFFSDSFISYAKLQTDILKDISPDKTVTHNICSSGFLFRMDNYKLGKLLDIVSLDNYPVGWTFETEYGNKEYRPFNPSIASLALSMTRSYKDRHFWITEAQVSAGMWDAMLSPGMVKLWSFQEIAHGARMIMYFKWRAFPFGVEQNGSGILDHDSVPRQIYNEVKATSQKAGSMQDSIYMASVKSQIAIIRDFDCDWAFECAGYYEDFKYIRHIHKYYEALFKRHLMSDIVSPEDDFSSYKMLIVPSLLLMNAERAKKISDFAANGGTVVITFLSGIRNMENVYITETKPGALREMTGIEIEAHIGFVNDQPVQIKPVKPSEDIINTIGCSVWSDIITSKTADILAVYASRFYKDSPAITVNDHGSGKVYYIATQPEDDYLAQLLEDIAKDKGIKAVIQCDSPMVEAVLNVNGQDEYIYIMNFDSNPQIIKLENRYMNIYRENEAALEFSIDPLETIILKKIP